MTHLAVEVEDLLEPTPSPVVAVVPVRPARPSHSTIFSTRLLVPLIASIFAVLFVAGLQFASSLLVPIAVAVLLTLLLGPLVRGMARYGVVEPVAAGISVFGTVTLISVAILVLAAPATDWLRRAPEAMQRVEERLRTVEPLHAIQATAGSLAHLTGDDGGPNTPRIQVASPGPLAQVGWTTAHVVGGILTIVFLTFFALASGSMFRRKIAYLFPSGTHRTRIKQALFEIEEQMSRYLLINTLISIGFGSATWVLLQILGVPDAALWGALAGVLNFIPYLGALVTLLLIAIVTLSSFDGTQPALLACGGFLLLDLVKGSVIGPVVLGRRMPLNTVAVLLSLLFWGWVWGTVGVIMAVPLTVMIQVVCSHSDRFRGLAIVLGNWGAQSRTRRPTPPDVKHQLDRLRPSS